MKALIRKCPDNTTTTESNEIWYPPWRNADEQGRPYTLEGYRYAYCDDAPEPVYDENGNMTSPIVDDFTVTEGSVKETDPASGETRTRLYWVAVYKGDSKTATEKSDSVTAEAGEDIVVDGDNIVIDGVSYSKEELRKLIGE